MGNLKQAKALTVVTIILIANLFEFFPIGANTFHLFVNKDNYKSGLVGEWQVTTEVVWSDCPYVDVGLTVDSNMIFTEINGRLFPQWQANGWVLVRNKSINFEDDDLLVWERENKLFKDDKFWFISAVDKFSYDDDSQLTATSYIKQYLNGEYVGSYVTFSKLSQ